MMLSVLREKNNILLPVYQLVGEGEEARTRGPEKVHVSGLVCHCGSHQEVLVCCYCWGGREEAAWAGWRVLADQND